MMSRIVCLAVAALLAACSGLEPTGEATLRLSGSSVRPGPGALLTAELTNASGQTLYLNACGEVPFVGLERRSGARWEPLSQSICPANRSMVRVGIAAGETRTMTKQLSDSVVEGAYRLRVTLHDAPDNGGSTEATADFGIGM